MSESNEALSHRLKNAQVLFSTLFLILIGLLGLIWATLLLPPQIGIPIGLALLALYLVVAFSFKNAYRYDGRARRLYERRYGEFDDPPLDDWEESLEDRNAFVDSDDL